MQDSNDEVLSGKRGLGFTAQGSCYPGGVPGQLLFPAEPFYFIQTPNPSSTLRAAGRLRNPHKTWIWAVRGPKV
jgi:PAB1-binding protein PBP1